MLRCHALAVVGCLITPMMAHAGTGAEFLQSDQAFASGFAFGVMRARLFLIDSSYDPYANTAMNRQRKCMIATKIDSNTFYEAVVQHIRTNPKSLADEDLVAVLETIADICGK